jgi:uncharacterized protein
MARDANGLVILSSDECLRLLNEHPVHVGRLAFTTEDGYPLVLPVNYRVDHGTVVFRTALGTKLDVVAKGIPVAFEVDELDSAWEEGWSVVIQGRAEEVTNPAEISRLQRLPIRPWGPGDRSRFVRIQPDKITGRRIA